MSRVHLYIGYVVPAAFLLLALWSLFAFLRNKTPSRWFWNLLGFVQVILGLQVVVGSLLFLTGLRPPPSGVAWLHYAYGGLFPAAVLVAAHRGARTHQDVAWVIFGFAAFVNFGLTFRALGTGLG